MGRTVMTKARLSGNRFLIRQGKVIIDHDNVTFFMKLPRGAIKCGHTIRHVDNELSEILLRIDTLIGGKASVRGWNYADIPVWFLSSARAQSFVMIARTRDDCHGKTIDGDELLAAYNDPPHQAVLTRGVFPNSLMRMLDLFDRFIDSTADVMMKYIADAKAILKDKSLSDDVLFCSRRETEHPSYRSRSYRDRNTISVDEMTSEMLLDIQRSAADFVLEVTCQKSFYNITDLVEDMSIHMVTSEIFALGLLCRIIPSSQMLGVNTCSFTGTTELPTQCKFLLDMEVSVSSLLFGSSNVRAMVEESGKILFQGASADNALFTIERRELLHVLSRGVKSCDEIDDENFKTVPAPSELLVGWSGGRAAISKLYELEGDVIRAVIRESSSSVRADKLLMRKCGLLFLRSTDIRTGFGAASPSSDQKDVVRQALESILVIQWNDYLQKGIQDFGKRRMSIDSVNLNVEAGFPSRIKNGVSITFNSRGSEAKGPVLCDGNDEVSVAASLRTATCLGIRNEGPYPCPWSANRINTSEGDRLLITSPVNSRIVVMSGVKVSLDDELTYLKAGSSPKARKTFDGKVHYAACDNSLLPEMNARGVGGLAGHVCVCNIGHGSS